MKTSLRGRGADDGPGGDVPPKAPPGLLLLGVVFTAEVLALGVLRLPEGLRFEWNTFYDPGANLTAQALLDRGDRPAVDFGYQYGLLALVVGRLWFGLVGRTPQGYLAAMAACNVLTAWGMARFATATRVGPAGLALLAASMAFAVSSTYPNLAQALEAVLICHALAEHARGRLPAALALLTACCFVKPSLSYVYGLILTMTILFDVRRGPGPWWRSLLGSLWPAAATAAALSALLAAVFGVVPLIRTVLPLSGAIAYRHANFGFFRGVGRSFWAPRGANLGYYVGGVAGFWLAGTVCLVGQALADVWRRLRGAMPAGGAGPLVACCAALHVVFVTLLFGNAWSWVYYSYILILGLSALSGRGRMQAGLVWALAVCALVGHKSLVASASRLWASTAPAAATAGLWASPGERAEWDRVLKADRGRETAVLGPAESCAALVFPGSGFAEPVGFFFLRGVALPAEVRRKASQVSAASAVLIPRHGHAGSGDSVLDQWPEFREALAGCEVALDGDYFTLYRRVGPPPDRASALWEQPGRAGP